MKEFTQAFAMLLNGLETANLLEPHFIVLFVMALTGTIVNLFVIAMLGLLTCTRTLEITSRERVYPSVRNAIGWTGNCESVGTSLYCPLCYGSYQDQR